MTKTNTGHKVYEVRRSASSSMEGCKGKATFYEVGGERLGHYGVPVEDILGRALGDKSVLKITVEVLTEKRIPAGCLNPWRAHDKHPGPGKATRKKKATS